MSLLDLEETQTRLGTSITQDHIDEAEGELAAIVGPLTGERTEKFLLSERADWRTVDGLWISRKADGVIVYSDGTLLTLDTDYRFLGNLLIERIPAGTVWGLVVTATYTPNDEETVRAVLYDWLQYRQTPSGVQSIRIGAYSETFFPEGSEEEIVVSSLVKRILPGASLGALSSPFRVASTRRDRTVIVSTGS